MLNFWFNELPDDDKSQSWVFFVSIFGQLIVTGYVLTLELASDSEENTLETSVVSEDT